MNQKSEYYRSFRIFGFRVYITRHPLRPRLRSDKRQSAYRQRMEFAGHACEICGAPLTKYGNKLHTLPKGHEDRNTFGELRVLCADCYKSISSQISKRCFDKALPEYTNIVNQAMAEAQKGGEK